MHTTNNVKPRWNSELRILSVDDVTVKRFQRPAPSQQAILAAFEEEGWPLRIDDPLIPAKGMQLSQIKDRLRSTVADLNRAQHGRTRVQFHTDGTGQGILWTLRR